MKWAEIEVAAFVERALKPFQAIAEKRGNKLVLTNRLVRHSERPAGVEESLFGEGEGCFDCAQDDKAGKGSFDSLRSLRMTEDAPLRLYADRQKLKKIINNLVGNAMKFTKDGEIEVVVDWMGRALLAAPNMCTISVRDTGAGISKEDLPNIFDPFTQASNNRMREVQGTGLGLAMVKDFVAFHHGEISVESELGKGSVFTVALPLGDAHVDKSKLDTSEILEGDDDAHISHINLGIKSFDEFDLSLFAAIDPDRSTLLLVEDNPQVLQALTYVLKDHYNLCFAKNGQDGLESAKSIKPDLIVSDIMMPKMNGYELVREIKEDPELRVIPVILLTSKADMESRIKGFEEGADEYLSKPFNNHEVLVRVSGLIARRKMEMEFIQAAEKMITLGQMAAGLGHEINNPIGYAETSAASVRKIFDAIKQGKLSLEDGMVRMDEAIGRIQEGTHRVKEITKTLKGLMRQKPDEFGESDIHPGIESSWLIVNASGKWQIKFEKHYELKDPVLCHLGRLNQVFLNLLHNAVQALENKADAAIWIHTYREGDQAIISIRDNGPGIPEEIQKKIFHPFFTTKEAGKGTGFGLYISKKIVQEHGGVLGLKSKIGEGTTFTVVLPKRQKEKIIFDPNAAVITA